MRSFFLLPVLVVAGCSGNAPTDGNTTGSADSGRELRYTVRAGPVPNAQASALSGTFQLLQTGDPSGIPSNRTGGACLAFPAADLGFTQMAAKQCSKNSDCSVTTENPVGYCDVGAKTCWSRPNRPGARAALCNTGITLNANDLNSVPAQPVNVAPLGIAIGAKVRVIACLNKAGAVPSATGCASKDGPDRIEVLGPIATIR